MFLGILAQNCIVGMMFTRVTHELHIRCVCLTERKYAIQHHVIENKRAAMRIPTTVTHDVTTPSQESVDFSEPNSPVSTANSTGSLSHGIGKFWWQYWWDFLLYFWYNRLACKKLSLIRSNFCHF